MALSNTTKLPKGTAEIQSHEIRLRNHINKYWNVIRKRAKVLANYYTDFNKIKDKKDIHEFFSKHQMPIADSLVDETFISENIKSTLKKYLIDDVWRNLPHKEFILKKIEDLFSKEDISKLLKEMKKRLDFYYPFYNLEMAIGDLKPWILNVKNSNLFVSNDLSSLLVILKDYKISEKVISKLEGHSKLNHIKAAEQLFNEVIKCHALQLAVLSGKYPNLNEGITPTQIKRLESKASHIIKRQSKKFSTKKQIKQLLKLIDLEMVALGALNIVILKIEDLAHYSLELLTNMLDTESELDKDANKSFTIKGPKYDLKCFVSYEPAGLFSGDFFHFRPNKNKLFSNIQNSTFAEFHVGDVAGKGFYAARAKEEFSRFEAKYHDYIMLSESSSLDDRFLNLIKKIGEELANCKISVGKHNFISNSSILINLENGNISYFSPAPIFFVKGFVKGGEVLTPPSNLSDNQSVMWLASIGNRLIPNWKLGSIKLKSKDFILATTDGLEELSVSGVEFGEVYDIKLLLKKYYGMDISSKSIIEALKKLQGYYRSGKFLEDFAEEVYSIKKKLNLTGDSAQQIVNEIQKFPDDNNYKKFLNALPEKKATLTKSAQTIKAIGETGKKVLTQV